MPTHLKDPDARLDYAFDWTPWLAGDTIVSATVTAELGLTVDGDPTVTATAVTVWLTDGTAGEDYRVTCRVTTAAGRVDDRTMHITVTDR